MSFRGDVAAKTGAEEARRYLIPRSFDRQTRERAGRKFDELLLKYGPVVAAYPSWHPLVAQHKDKSSPATYPSDRCGYKGLDHTIYLAHAFVTCPYDDGQVVIDSVNLLDAPPCASLSAERLGVHFYNESTTPILVSCEWSLPLDEDHAIPKCVALPLMLEQELPAWRWAQVSETWEDMRPYFLGRPHGNRSSLFVSQETALTLKKTYELMVESGMYNSVCR